MALASHSAPPVTPGRSGWGGGLPSLQVQLTPRQREAELGVQCLLPLTSPAALAGAPPAPQHSWAQGPGGLSCLLPRNPALFSLPTFPLAGSWPAPGSRPSTGVPWGPSLHSGMRAPPESRNRGSGSYRDPECWEELTCGPT